MPAITYTHERYVRISNLAVKGQSEGAAVIYLNQIRRSEITISCVKICLIIVVIIISIYVVVTVRPGQAYTNALASICQGACGR